MKHILILSAILLISHLSFAQAPDKVSNKLNEHRQFLSGLLGVQMQGHTGMKTTAVKERLVGQSILDNTLSIPALIDSVGLGYQGNRGSTYDLNLMFYAFNYQYGNTPTFTYNGLFSRPQILYDTMLRWTVAPGDTVYHFFEAGLAGYDAANNVISYKDSFNDPITYPQQRYLNNFNAAGNIVRGYTFNVSGSVIDSAYAQYYTYNSANKIIADSIYVYTGSGWNIVAKSKYAYDAAGNLITIDTYADSTGPLREKLKYENTYDASKRLLTVLTSYFDGTNLTAYVKDTFAYTASLPFHTSWKEYQYDGINHYWAPYLYMVKHINTASLPDTIYIKGFDSLKNAWVPQLKQVANYDTFNNPVKLMAYTYNGFAYSSSATNVTSYYYRRYTTARVANVALLSDVSVYPNPVSDHLNININGLHDNTRIVINLYNNNGQVLHSIRTIWQQSTLQLPMADLAAGTYWVTIQNAEGQILYRQGVVKH